ncbi:MAG: response regulator [Candidatus Flexifilum sp.]
MKIRSGSAVPRHMVFVLDNGEPVVQWTELHVQELLTGRYRPYDISQFGHPISDLELEQLKHNGLLEDYNRQYVWLYALPESGRFGLRTQEASHGRRRIFYINTTLPATELGRVEQEVSSGGLGGAFTVREYDDLVTVWRKNGDGFDELPDAEDALRWLLNAAPQTFQHAAVAFIETANNRSPERAKPEPTLSLEAVLSAFDTAETRAVSAGRTAVLVIADADEREAIIPVLRDLHVQPVAVPTGRDALHALEDLRPDLLITDVTLPDLHAWQLLNKAREIDVLETTGVIVIGDAAGQGETNGHADSIFALTVAGVDEYLARPINRSRLRACVIAALKRRYP